MQKCFFLQKAAWVLVLPLTFVFEVSWVPFWMVGLFTRNEFLFPLPLPLDCLILPLLWLPS